MRLSVGIAVVGMVFLLGCSEKPRPPKGAHWGTGLSIGDQLYCDTDGRKAASVIDDQACVFIGSGACEHFEHHYQALEYAAQNTRCPEATR